MKVQVIGVGEAFATNHPNNAHLILSDTKLLLDCGTTIPQRLWQYNNDQSFLDAVYISHAHADHYFGLPQLLLKMWREGRTKPFTIICPEGLKDQMINMLTLGYRNIMDKITSQFKTEFIEVNTKEPLQFREFTMNFAVTIHPVNNLAIRIYDGKKAICYSGDGDFTEESKALYKDADLLIHETFLFEEKIKGHATIQETIEMADRQGVKTLALTHLKEDFREAFVGLKKDYSTERLKVILPEPGDTIDLEQETDQTAI